MKVLIIGGGIAGPALALVLKRSGHDVEVYDRVVPPSRFAGSNWVPADIGGAILLNENVLRVFKYLGLLDEIMAAGTQVVRNELGKFDGRPMAVWNTFDGDEFVTTGILRSSITRIVSKAMNQAGVFTKANKKLIAIDQPSDGRLGVIAHFEDGTNAYGDILVGADGINSTTRSLLFPDVKLKQSQYSGYFAVSPLDGAPSPTVFSVLLDGRTGNNAFVMPAGDKMVNWGLYESRPESGEILGNTWDLNGDLDRERGRMLQLIDKWSLPSHFREYAKRTARVIHVNFAAVPSMPSWHKQNCVLIGDAVHGMFPFLGQGAGMTLEDVVALSMLLNRLPDQPRRAFELLRELRAPRVEKVATLSEVLGERTTGSSPTAAAIGNVIMRVLSYVSRFTRSSFFNNEVIRYDCYHETQKFMQLKSLGTV